MAESSDAITGKFDFYDILGYLVPSLVFLGLVALPFGLIKRTWPSTSFTSAVLYLVAAHILGNILQGFLRAWESVPRIKDYKDKMRPPSSVFLDEGPRSLAPMVRAKIKGLTNKFWTIPETTGPKEESWDDVLDSDRAAVFLQARNLLLQSKKQSYFEQFEGKYALMGGVAASLIIVALYYVGWAVALVPSSCRGWVQWLGDALAPYLVFFAAYLVFVQLRSRGMKEAPRVVNLFLLLLLCIGAFLGGYRVAGIPQQPSGTKTAQTEKTAEVPKGSTTPYVVCCVAKNESSESSNTLPDLQIEHQATFMLILALVAFGAAVRCYGAYKAFAREFAIGVWRDFANFELICESANKSTDGKPNHKSNGEIGHAPSQEQNKAE